MKIAFEGPECSTVVEHWPSMHKALSSNPEVPEDPTMRKRINTTAMEILKYDL